MKHFNRTQLIDYIKSIVSNGAVQKPIILIGDNDNERRDIINRLFEGSICNINYADDWQSLEACVEKNSAIQVPCRNYDIKLYVAAPYEDTLKDDHLTYCVYIHKHTKKPVIYNVYKNDALVFPKNIEEYFDVIEFSQTKQEWLEWAKGSDENGNPNISPIITDFLDKVDDKYFKGTAVGRNARCGTLGWAYVNTACNVAQDYPNPMAYIAEDVETTFNKEFADAFRAYYGLPK